MPIDPDDDDELDDEPQVRVGPMIFGSASALAGLVGVVVAASALMGPAVTPEKTKGEVSVILAPLGAAITVIVLLVSLILLLAGAAAAITALVEARAARRLAEARASERA